MLAIIISALFIAAAMVMNGAAGSKYGVPFAMILRGSYGVRGALFLDYCEGESRQLCGSAYSVTRIAGISYFDWEDLAGFLTLGGDFKLLGLSLP